MAAVAMGEVTPKQAVALSGGKDSTTIFWYSVKHAETKKIL
jgi:tRNA(Ile)-lysidine synthase TilS/MesJ